MHPYQRQIDACNAALEITRGSISDERYSEVSYYINEVNEWGLGIEFLIDWICDDDIAISETQRDCILSALTSMGLDKSSRAEWLSRQCRQR